MLSKIIILAGYTASGKSVLGKMINEKIGGFKLIALDDIKEKIFDENGFDDITEKNKLIQISYNEFYKIVEDVMKESSNIMIDYPFSDKQYNALSLLIAKYNYDSLTIRIVGDINVLFERRIKRDKDKTRHLGHIVNCYHYGMKLENRLNASALITKKEFVDVCLNRGYDRFVIGNLMEVDTTDFSKVNYDVIINDVKKYILK